MLFVWLMIMVLIMFADQLTKYLVILFLKPVQDVPLWQNVFHFTYVQNEGAAWGMFSDQRWVFMVISTVAIVGILIYFFWKKPTDKLQCLSLAFVVGGGVGNMIDRTILGYVVDFLHVYLYYPGFKTEDGVRTFGLVAYDFPVFNVADCFVTVGAGLMMLWAIWGLIKESKKSKPVLAEAEEDAETQPYGEAESDELAESDLEPMAEDTTDAGE